MKKKMYLKARVFEGEAEGKAMYELLHLMIHIMMMMMILVLLRKETSILKES